MFGAYFIFLSIKLFSRFIAQLNFLPAMFPTICFSSPPKNRFDDLKFNLTLDENLARKDNMQSSR